MLVHLKTCPRYQPLFRILGMDVCQFRVAFIPNLNLPLVSVVIRAKHVTVDFLKLALAIITEVPSG